MESRAAGRQKTQKTQKGGLGGLFRCAAPSGVSTDRGTTANSKAGRNEAAVDPHVLNVSDQRLSEPQPQPKPKPEPEPEPEPEREAEMAAPSQEPVLIEVSGDRYFKALSAWRESVQTGDILRLTRVLQNGWLEGFKTS
eukprot:COSAG02_NODE_13045_length_1454_cov_1.429520_1_plen_138_part_10